MRLGLLVLFLLAALPVVSAQRRATPPPAVDVALTQDASQPLRYTVTAVARVDADVIADLRWLHLDVRAPGARRSLPCDAPGRPRRVPADAVRTLRAGESWSESFDVRRICWGRALTTLSAGGELGGTLGTTRSRTGARAAGTGTFRAASIPFAPVVAVPPPPAPTGDVRITLAPTDAITGSRVSFRVSVRATRPVRAFVRPDHVRFRVRDPEGREHRCAIEEIERAPIADLFQRIGTRSGPFFSLDARTYCAPGVFAAAGIYEVTPILVLDVDGSEWRMDTPLGTFEGAPAPVRVRSTTP